MAAVTAALKLFSGHINPTTVALALLLVVLFVATWWGARPAVAASLLGVLCFSFFFLPPVGTLTMPPRTMDRALCVPRHGYHRRATLCAAKRSTEEADAGRREIERLTKSCVMPSSERVTRKRSSRARNEISAARRRHP